MENTVVNSLLALLVAFGVAALLGPIVIPILHRLKFGQNVRDDGPKTHLKKQNTPTMGGVMILIAIVAATLIFAHKNYSLALWALLFAVLFGLVGFLDDFIKIIKKRSMGLHAWQKIAAQFVLSLGFAIALYFHPAVGSTIWLDRLDLGIFFIPFAMFVIIAAVNSVNLIDGLDGLSSSVTSIYSTGSGLIVLLYLLTFSSASLSGEQAVIMSDTLGGLSGLAVFSFATAGALPSIVIPENITFIGYSAFEECASASYVSLPSSLKQLGEAAFKNCGSLRYVLVNAVEPPQGAPKLSWFDTGEERFTPFRGPIYVPDESVETYKTDTYFSEYASQIRPMSEFSPVGE